MIDRPTTLAALAAALASAEAAAPVPAVGSSPLDRPVVLRAGGTDLQERLGSERRAGRRLPTIVDVGGVEPLCGIHPVPGGGVLLGAATTVMVLAESAVVAAWPALAAAAGGLATPQIRAVATMGGNLLQATRCPYVRNLDVSCWRTGGIGCAARDGVHDRGVVIDLGPCVAPHPSTLAAALLAHEATIVVAGAEGQEEWSLSAVLGDGTDATVDHQLDGDEVLVGARLPAPWPDERGAYVRAAGRQLAEWPLVEAVVRLAVGDVITRAAVAVGGVAAVPLRLPEVEAALVGHAPTAAVVAAAAAAATARCTPLPQTGYKVPLLVGTVQSALEEALGEALR